MPTAPANGPAPLDPAPAANASGLTLDAAIGMAIAAAAVNLWCLRLRNKLKNKDVNLRAATTFSFNDFVSNGGIVFAGIAVMLTGANWPDLIVGIAVACIAVYGGIEILRDAHKDTHQ